MGTVEGSENDEDAGGIAVETTPLIAGDDIKTGLQLERTWFKWLFTGLQIGGFGTWLVKMFSEQHPVTLYLVLFSWLVAFSVVLYGLERFYTRRRAIKYGMTDPASFESPFSILFVTMAVSVVIGGSVFYTVYANLTTGV